MTCCEVVMSGGGAVLFVDTSRTSDLVTAMRMMASDTTAKADPEIFSAVADRLESVELDPIMHAHGMWDETTGKHICSHCYEPRVAITTPHCPYCGARMDEYE